MHVQHRSATAFSTTGCGCLLAPPTSNHRDSCRDIHLYSQYVIDMKCYYDFIYMYDGILQVLSSYVRRVHTTCVDYSLECFSLSKASSLSPPSFYC